MPIYFFVASLFFVWIVAKKKGIKAISPYWIFILFQILYNTIPWTLNRFDMTPSLFALLSEKRLVDIQLLCSAMANVCFAMVYLFFWKNVPHRNPEKTLPARKRRNYVLFAFPLFILVCILAHFYGWHEYTAAGLEGSELGGMFTVTAYAKFLFVAVYLYYLYKFGIDKYASILMVEHVVVLFVDGARTTFLPIVLITIFMLIDKVKNRKSLRIIYALAITGVVASIGARSLVLKSSGVLTNMLIPITVEGSMGAYPSLQSIHGIEYTLNPAYTLGASYVIDPIIWMAPKSLGREKITFLQGWVDSIDHGLKDQFAPMGGFYYLAEALAAFSYPGAFIVTTAFALQMVWMERNKNRFRLLYLIWMPTVGITFVKAEFGNAFKNLIIQLACVVVIKTLGKIKSILAWSMNPTITEGILETEDLGSYAGGSLRNEFPISVDAYKSSPRSALDSGVTY